MRKRGPLSLNIATNGLQRMVKLAETNGQVVVLVPHLIDKGVFIFQYVDDTILFIQDDIESARNLKLLLYLFELMYRLKINFQSSETLMLLHDDERGRMYVDLFNYQLGCWPIRYLVCQFVLVGCM